MKDKNKELAKNTAIITVGKICTQFMSFFLMPLYTAILSTKEYGIVDLIVTYTSLFLPVILFQVDAALFRFLVDAREKENSKKELISTSVLFALLQIFASLAIFSVIQIFISSEYKYFLLFNIIASIYSSLMLQIARGFGDNSGYALGSFVSAFSQIVGNIVLLIVFDMGVYGMLIATIAAQIITGTLIFFKDKVYKYISIKDFRKVKLKEILAYSVPLIPNSLAWWAINASDRTIVLVVLGEAANGLLAVGHKFSTVYMTFYNIFNLSWTESAALHMQDDDRDEFFSGVISNMFKLFMSAAIGLIAFMPFLFPIMINKQYNEAYNIVPIFILASMLNVIVNLYSVVYIALKKTKEIAKTSIYSGIINIVTHILLVNFIGLYASAVSTAIAFGIMALYRYIDLKKYINIQLPCKYVLTILCMFIVSMFAYYSNNMIIQLLVLLSIFVLAVILNFSMFISALEIIEGKLKKPGLLSAKFKKIKTKLSSKTNK